MRRSLVGFESPNFGHAFLDGFDDLDSRDDYGEDSVYFGDEISSRTPRNNRGVDVGRPRARALTVSEGAPMRGNHTTGLSGLRELSSSKWQDKHSPEVLDQYNSIHLSEPEPSLDDKLVAPPPDWAICCVCHEIYKKPTTTVCGHSFCYDCIIEVIHRKGTCPLCRHPIGINEITEDKKASQAMSGLTVRCKYGLRLVSAPSLPINSSLSSSSSTIGLSSHSLPSHSPHYPSNNVTTSTTTSTTTTTTTITTSTPSATTPTSTTARGGTSSPITIRNSPSHPPPLFHARSLPSALPSFMRTAAKWAPIANACDATFTLAQQAAHEAECPYRPVDCYNDGCKEKIKSKDLELHMETCARRVVQCHDCKEMYLLVDQSSHDASCPEKDLGCPHKCNVKVRRKEQADHLTVCTNMEVTCAHAQYGCTFRGMRSAYQAHQASCMFRGMAAVLGGLAQQVAQLTLDTKSQAITIASLQQELRSMQAQVREQAAEIRNLRDASSTRQSLFSRDTLFE